MKNRIAAAVLILAGALAAPPVNAGHAHVVRTRTVVRVHPGFPLHRTLPHVYVRAPRVVVRVAPRHFLPAVVFGAVVVPSSPPQESIVWRDTESIERDDEWTELTLNADRAGKRLLLEIARNPAEISFAEVVFANGDAQVVDFDDNRHAIGTFSLLDFKDGRKVDHVRVVAKTDAEDSEIRLLLVR